MSDLLTKALELIKAGYTVIPLAGKRPVLDRWQNLRNVTPEMVHDWQRAGLLKNLGMVCGSASKNTVVIDFDGLAGYELFKTQFPDLIDTLTVLTGSGAGIHCYYHVDLLPDSAGVLDIRLDSGELVNIEFKSDGKQVVIPPSIHPDTQQPYTVQNRVQIKRVTDLTKVIQWAKSLKPEIQVWQPPASWTRSDDLNPTLLSAVASYFTSRPHKIHREWINCSCPNTSAHKHGDKDFSFGYHPDGVGHCYVCGSMNLKTLLPLIGFNAQDYGGFYVRNEQAAITPDIRIATSAIHAPPQTAQAVGIPVVTRSSRLSDYSRRIDDYDMPRSKPPIPFPLRALHQFGGMAQVVKPGKLIGIVGLSGGGKTSLLETMVDGWLSMHVSCLVWSPEWDADEFIERAVQRYGGPTMDELYMHDIFVSEKQRGIEHGFGKELNENQQKLAHDAIRRLRGWQNEVGYLDCPYMTIGYLQSSIEATLKAISFKPQALIIDYVQLLHALETSSDLTMYNLLMRLKAVCRTYDLVGVIASQVTKDSARRSADGQMLDGLAARYVNDDAFNLFVTINPEYSKENGERLPSAVLNISKSSVGKRGKVRLGVDWSRLMFDDRPHPDQFFEVDV